MHRSASCTLSPSRPTETHVRVGCYIPPTNQQGRGNLTRRTLPTDPPWSPGTRGGETSAWPWLSQATLPPGNRSRPELEDVTLRPLAEPMVLVRTAPRPQGAAG